MLVLSSGTDRYSFWGNISPDIPIPNINPVINYQPLVFPAMSKPFPLRVARAFLPTVSSLVVTRN